MTNNNKFFGLVFLLLLTFGIILILLLFILGKAQYLSLVIMAELLIIANLFIWRWLLRWQSLLKKPILLLSIYLAKISFIVIILAVMYRYLPNINNFFNSFF